MSDPATTNPSMVTFRCLVGETTVLRPDQILAPRSPFEGIAQRIAEAERIAPSGMRAGGMIDLDVTSHTREE